MDAWRAQSSRKSAYTASVPTAPGGNTPWAQSYGTEIRQLIERQVARAPRSGNSSKSSPSICHMRFSPSGDVLPRQLYLRT